MIRYISATAFAVMVSLAAVTYGQVVVGGAGPAYGWGGWGWGGWGGGTVAGNYMQGMSQVVQAQGARNLMNSQAAINLETARSQNLDNRLKYTNTYFEMRRINTAARQAEQGRGLSTEEAWRYAQIGVPRRMTPNELDPVTGTIHWPVTLMDPRYEEFRKELDRLFQERETAHGSIGYEVFTQIGTTTSAFLAALQENIKDFPNANEYLQAKTFVQALANEARFPAA